MCSIPAQLAGDVSQNLVRKHTTASASGPLFHQFQKHAFSLLADRRQVLQIDHEFTAVKSRSRPFAGGLQLVGPRCDEPALYHQPALLPSFDNRDLQHPGFLCDRATIEKAMRMPERGAPPRLCKSFIYLEIIAGMRGLRWKCQRASASELVGCQVPGTEKNDLERVPLGGKEVKATTRNDVRCRACSFSVGGWTFSLRASPPRPWDQPRPNWIVSRL
jgi:hypothetical protein